MADQSGQPGAKAQVLNDRTYQEVEYLKKNLGPILVAALAEICIRRPADPIEYLGHWLLRWRYNEELKRRDVQNALEVVRQKAWSKDDGSMQPADNPLTPQSFTQGFTPTTPYAAPGFGGPLDQNVVEQAEAPQASDSGAAEKIPSAGEARTSQGGAGSGEIKSPSGGVDAPPSGDVKRPSATAEAIKEPGDGGEALEGRMDGVKRPSRNSGTLAEDPSAAPAGEAPTEDNIPPPEPEAVAEADAEPSAGD